MSTELTLNVANKLGTIRGTANTLTLYSLAPSTVNEKNFQPIVTLYKPTLEDLKPTIETISVFENDKAYKALPDTTLKGYTYVFANQEEYAQAILPDWVDVYIDEKPKLPWQKDVSVNHPTIDVMTPVIEDISVFEDDKVYSALPDTTLKGYAYVLSEDKIDEYFCGKIGKNSWVVNQTNELFVEYCNETIDVIHQYSLAMELPIASTTVLAKVEVEIDTGTGTGNSGELKSIEFLTNKNNYVDIYIDMDNIMTIENLPNGLVYKDNHVKGTPNQSGLFISTIIIGTPIFGITAKYTMKFKIPTFERLL